MLTGTVRETSSICQADIAARCAGAAEIGGGSLDLRRTLEHLWIERGALL
jgi:hypothetical protein